MNLLIKIILAVDSILLIIVLLALINGGIFPHPEEIRKDPITSIQMRSLPTMTTSTISPPLTLNEFISPTTCSDADVRENTKRRFSFHPSASTFCISSVWDLFLYFIPHSGLIYRIFSLIYNLVLCITFYDILFMYLICGIIYLFYNYYVCFKISRVPCQESFIATSTQTKQSQLQGITSSIGISGPPHEIAYQDQYIDLQSNTQHMPSKELNPNTTIPNHLYTENPVNTFPLLDTPSLDNSNKVPFQRRKHKRKHPHV